MISLYVMFEAYFYVSSAVAISHSSRNLYENHPNNNMSKSILVMDRSLHFLVGHCKVIMGGLQWIVVYVYSSSFDIEGIICIV
jgi:hypothetical protein